MKAPHSTRRLSREMLAAAKALRKVQARLSQLVRRDHPTFVGQRAAKAILHDGANIAEALDRLAERYDIADE